MTWFVKMRDARSQHMWRKHTPHFLLRTLHKGLPILCAPRIPERYRMQQEWLAYLERLSWNNPITLTLVSAAVGSVITLAWISARDARERKRQRHDTAIELALSLESFARSCRTMMHKATWATSKPAGPVSRESSQGVFIPTFFYPDKLQWHVLSRRVISELREYPAMVHAAREYVEALREFAEPIEVCGQVEYECAKAAMSAISLARITRRRHGVVTWKPGAKDSAIERELADFIADAEEKRKASLERRTVSQVGWGADSQPFRQPLSA